MKIFMLSAFFSLSFFCASAQRYDTTNLPKRMALAGNQLLEFRSNYNIGLTLIILGGAAAGGGAAADSKNNSAIIGVGAGLAVIGSIFIIAAHTHIGRAGFFLRGNSIIVPLPR